MAKKTQHKITGSEKNELLKILEERFQKNRQRHKDIDWIAVRKKLDATADKLWSLNEMEQTGGEPDVIGFDKKSGAYLFADCAEESPKGRRSLCYDREGLDSRKEFKPADSALDVANAMGAKLMNEEQYRYLQSLEKFDLKTSSWIETPADIRKLGGALFGDRRYDTVFIYHNGASSYYANRGFRVLLSL